MNLVPSTLRTELRDRFVERLLAETPSSVLDVGCGQGGALSLLRAGSVRAVGVERDRERLATCAGAGLSVVSANADELPFASGAFDWVSLRHVLHHLAAPVAAVSEAARVARTGLVLAEPWRDPHAPGSDLARRLDDWMRRQDRRLGHVHGDDITPHGLVELLPDGRWKVSHVSFVASRAASLEDLVHELDERLMGLSNEDDERALRDALLAEARVAGLAPPGSTLLVARRR